MSVKFSPTTWVDNNQPAITASQLNRIEKGIKDCAEAFNQSSAVYNFKGTLERYQELPNLGNEIGDTYNILNTGKNYAWNGIEWFEINVSLDITPFTEDYIIEQGVNGIWTYRKWASGIAECWGVLNTSVKPEYSWGDTHYYGRLDNIYFPNQLFVNTPVISISVSDENGNFYVTNRGSTAQQVGETFAVTVVAVETATAIRLSLEAKGAWK